MLEDIKTLLLQPEGSTLKYKYTLPPPSLLGRIIAAFANTEGGWLIIGVKESQSCLEIVGLADDVPAAAVVDSAILRLRPHPDVNHDWVLIDNKCLYAIEVKKSARLVITEDQSVFVRRGSEISKATPEEIFIIDKIKKSSCLHQIIEQILNEENNSTESKLVFLRQYKNLAIIAGQSANIICPDSPNISSKFPQGRSLIRLLFSSLADTFERYLADLLFLQELQKQALQLPISDHNLIFFRVGYYIINSPF
ncbi:ATP-binding protein [Anabaena cylindrica FACHB-243]|uniref:Transcriptional regulator n=1 Tax=Anabaena cylindrica (strain ATCC 27899 / PCC 7122) TaxID=272123 RepID=K9ZM47_ANACC|nr:MULTISPECIES: ATP-binding protein [Anabaena]AFZ60261.1 putative transcriptional regulator [Anabaena cylindrica PCC 7122]MBD2417686.1 ATP-binding protein [Anabaena cylindrica FACHB-243]MBY5281263.1 ATP-binding protein [Anabaena sp. CCAP 1446/1C]MBY5306653.1 ATP-binding protein [Anabaena sp. CCAP 1446/1C]MCM2404601.1 ATP-binding protein [Anabaena sp. CCAP 1446/1C]